MSNQQHTPEPWHADGADVVAMVEQYPSVVADCLNHASVGRKDSEANARRISAAVNACKRFPIGVLEAVAACGGITHEPVEELIAVTKQRDELLAALEAGRRLIELISPFEGDVTRQMDKAISSVKGGAA